MTESIPKSSASELACLVLERAREGRSAHFEVHEHRDSAVRDTLGASVHRRIERGEIPGRMRHFDAACPTLRDRKHLALDRRDAMEAARLAIDLIVPSVLLDAGAGPVWSFECDGRRLLRSEGLAAASLSMFLDGALGHAPARTDGASLAALGESTLRRALQLRADNPIRGFDVRLGVLRRLGQALTRHDAIFPGHRPGGIADWATARATRSDDGTRTLFAADLLDALCGALADVWPPLPRLPSEPPGDVFSLERVSPELEGLVAFHKLAHFLTYSLVEPLASIGVRVVERPGATLVPLAEYRNGGLLLDAGILELKVPIPKNATFAVGDPLVVEWRCLTVALLGRLRERVLRDAFGPEPSRWPTHAITQFDASSWELGRSLAFENRPGGDPPIIVDGDGAIF